MRKCAIILLLAGLAAPGLAAQRKPDSGEYIPQGAPKCVEIGNFYLRRKDYKGALSRFKEAVKTDSMYAPGYLGLGKVYEKIGEKRKALAAYRKYLDELPSEKQADEAKNVHKTIDRLEQELEHAPKPPSRASPSARPHP